MHDETFEHIANRVYKKSIEQYEKESSYDTSKILTDRDFIEFVEKKINAAMAHNERYTGNLVKAIIQFYETKNQR